jgi:hypothetical protein
MTAVDTRNFLKHEIDFLPESVLDSVKDFVMRQKQFVSESDLAAGQECELCKVYRTPNAETIAAWREAEGIAEGKIKAKQYKSSSEMSADILSDEDDEEDG